MFMMTTDSKFNSKYHQVMNRLMPSFKNMDIVFRFLIMNILMLQSLSCSPTTCNHASCDTRDREKLKNKTAISVQTLFDESSVQTSSHLVQSKINKLFLNQQTKVS